MSTTTMGNQRRMAKRKRHTSEASGSETCMSCGEVNKASARFCQGCGRSLVKGTWLDAQSMTVIGASLVTLLTLGLLFASVIDMGGKIDRGASVPTSTRTVSSSDGQPPDLSTMTPREAAYRLFNRVMMADEQGNTDEVMQFAPMALAAYDRIEALDLEATYHIGLISAAADDPDKAEDVVNRLRAVVPDHLLASILEHRLAVDRNDQAKAEQAIERFQNAYDAEISVDRPEYRGHQRQIDQFQQRFGDANSDG